MNERKAKQARRQERLKAYKTKVMMVSELARYFTNQEDASHEETEHEREARYLEHVSSLWALDIGQLVELGTHLVMGQTLFTDTAPGKVA